MRTSPPFVTRSTTAFIAPRTPARLAARTAFGKRCASFNRPGSDTACGVSKIRRWSNISFASAFIWKFVPTSNLQTGISRDFAEHAVDDLYRAGVPLSISTDTRTITNITLTEEYRNLEEHFRWTDADLAACNQAAIDAAFIDDSLKHRLKLAPHGLLQVKFAASSVLPLPL